ncbi:MAG: pantetheine-phosphate adenylyltransferase [Anaerolineae bacterium]
MKKALFPGTFDPPSLGHLDVIKRATQICDKLIIGIAVNASKEKESFTPQEKIAMLQAITKGIEHIEIACFSRLVVDYAKEHQVDFLVRGLRAFSDFEYEFRMALANRKISGIETVFLMADERYAHVSSTLIRELSLYNSRLHDFVPEAIEAQVFERLSPSKNPL